MLLSNYGAVDSQIKPGELDKFVAVSGLFAGFAPHVM